MLFRVGGCILITTLLGGCGNIAAVKSFSTKFESPASGETANLRVISNGMVRGVPNSDCIDWYLPGAGVIVVSKDGFAHRNGESLGMPDSKWTTTSSIKDFYSSEVRIPAGKPFSLHFLGSGNVNAYARTQCVSSQAFVPKPGHNYEYVVIETGSVCSSRLVEYLDDQHEEKVELKGAPFCKAWHQF